jgi:hypothetical protein
MERLAKNKLDRSEIAGAVISGSMTPKEGVAATLKLQQEARAHSDSVKAYLDEQAKSGAVTKPSQTVPVGTVQYNSVTKERRIMRDNGWEVIPGGE